MPLRKTAISFAYSVFVLLLVGCEKEIDPVNVVIVTIDTTRADHIGCYGHPRSKTPVIDGLAEEGVLFEKAFTPVPITCPSHSTMMTGKVPFGHGIRDNGLFVLGDDQVTLAEVLKEHGYSCAAAIGAFPLLARFGLDQGFDLYDEQLGEVAEDPFGNRIIKKRSLFFDERKASLVNESVFPWLEENTKDPFFLWVHYFDPHHPHEPPTPYDHEFADDLYLGEIAYSDECVGVLMQKLKDLGVYDNTLVVVLSDHGEGLWEHNEYTHSLLAYNSTLRVPLVIRDPSGVSGRRVEQRVGTVDLFPTILERIGIRLPNDLHGSSLLGFLRGEDEGKARSLYAETIAPRLSHGLGEIRAYFDGNYKYLHGPIKELYDLENDPGELVNLIESEPGIASEMRTKLEKYLDENAKASVGQKVAIDEETERRLMALGYLGSSGAVEVGQETLRDDGVAPQERVVDNALLSRAKHYLNLKRPLKARQAVDDLLDRAPDNPAYVSMLAECKRMAGDFEGALQTFERLLEMENAQAVIKPEKTLLLMSNLHLSLGNVDKALDLISESQEFADTGQSHYLLAMIYQELGKEKERLAELEKAVEFEDIPVSAHRQLGVAKAELGDLDGAEEQFRKALELEPYSSTLHYNLAAFTYQKGEIDEAVRLAERAIELKPDYILAHYLRFQLLREAGETERSSEALAEAAKIAPDHPLVRMMRRME